MKDNYNYVFTKLKKMLNKKNVQKNVKLSEHTSFKIGGKARIFVQLNTLEEITKCLTFLIDNNIRYFVLGNGTNVLADSNGYNGVVITLKNGYTEIMKMGNSIIANAGVKLIDLITFAKNEGLSGLESATGIPGTVGGAIYMNAHAYDFEVCNVINSVLAFVNGKIQLFKLDDCKFDYRYSIFQELKNCLILQAQFDLKKDSIININNKMIETIKKRNATQPMGSLSAGSVFKNPRIDLPIGKIIDKMGLKGYNINGAEISEIHANYIINKKNAKSNDVVDLINYIKREVKKTHNIELYPEIKYLGDKNDIW